MGKRVPKRVLGEGTLGGRGPRPGWVGAAALATSDGKEKKNHVIPYRVYMARVCAPSTKPTETHLRTHGHAHMLMLLPMLLPYVSGEAHGML